MNYIYAMKTAILIFPLIALIITIPFTLSEYHKYGSISKLRTIIIYSFILYLLTIYFLVILPLPTFEKVENMNPLKIRRIPLTFITDILNESSFIIQNPKTYLKALTEPCIYTVVFNIFMTIPFGMYLRYYFKCNLKKTILFSFLLSLFFELTQLTGLYFIYPKAYRLFDVDDLLMNTLGGIVGYSLLNLINKFLPTREEIDKKALEEGKNVSGLRRITLFSLDIFIYFIIQIMSFLFIKNKYLKYGTFILYYVMIPYFNKGKTLAGNYLNVKIVFKNKVVIRSFGRILFLYIYYFYIPYIFLVLIIKKVPKLNFTIQKEATILILYSIGIILFYLVNAITILRKKKIYYDKIFKVEYQSTIEERK